MKRIALFVLTTCTLSLPLFAWEILVTKDGTEIAGDITQAEFLLNDPSGGEIIIPRAAIDRFEFGSQLMEATLKDGTVVTGELKGHIEIEDGSIRRRYQGSDVQRIDFDNFIPLKRGHQYHSCPIRLSLPAGRLTSESSTWSTSLTGAVKCDKQKIVNIAFHRRGDLTKRKGATVTARFTVWVPPGPDQLADLSIEVVQDGKVLGAGRKRLTLDEEEMNLVALKFDLSKTPYDADGSEPLFRVQLVTQDEDREVERGGFFWWFTVPIPL